MTNASFDEAAARAWLESPDKDHPNYTVAEEVGIDEDFKYGYGGIDFLATVDRLVAKASDTELLPKDTFVWLVCDTGGVCDGALIVRDISNDVRLCSHHHEAHDLTEDTDATGIDQAIAILQAVHWTASTLTPPKPESDVTEMQEAVNAAKVAARGDSNDEEIEALQGALELALRRWPEVNADPDIEDQLDNVKDD